MLIFLLIMQFYIYSCHEVSSTYFSGLMTLRTENDSNSTKDLCKNQTQDLRVFFSTKHEKFNRISSSKGKDKYECLTRNSREQSS